MKTVSLPAVLLAALLAALPLAAQPAPPDGRAVPSARVQLFGEAGPEAVRIRLEEGRRAALFAGSASGAPLLELQGGETLRIGRRGEELRIEGPGGRLFARSLRLAPQGDAASDPFAATWRVAVEAGRRQPGPRTYTGSLALAPSRGETLRIVNTVALAPYVASVVGGEYGFDDVEGSKAMAVAARTYFLRMLQENDARHVLPDHVGAQVYRGTGRVTPAGRRAAEATRGEVLTFEGTPIRAVYHAASGGHTASNEDVWDAAAPLPYLRGQADPYTDERSPHHRWRVSIDRSRLLDRLSERYDMRAAGFVVAERSDDGRARQIELLQRGGPSHLVSGNDFRLFANRQTSGRGLRSTLFEAERQGDRYVFEGRGYGHGVGLSQLGTRAMARDGSSYREILAFYYPGARLTHLDDEVLGDGDAPALTDGAPLPPPPATADLPAATSPPRSEDQAKSETEGNETEAAPRSSEERIGW